MKRKILAEIPLWVLILIPVVLLRLFWSALPEQVPLHYNLFGEADKWGSKFDLWYLFTLIPLGCYVLLFVADKIDPKNMLSHMGRKFYIIRFGITLFLAAILSLMLYALSNEKANFQSYIFILISFMFIFSGNYFRNIKPNYFLGFRTPWALENNQVWKETHLHSSLIWFIGGFIMLVNNIWNPLSSVWLINAVLITLLIIDPIVYSFIKYQQSKEIQP